MKGVVLYDFDSHTNLVSRNVIHHEHIFPYPNTNSINWDYHTYKDSFNPSQHDHVIPTPSHTESSQHEPVLSQSEPSQTEPITHDIQSTPDVENNDIQTITQTAHNTPAAQDTEPQSIPVRT